MQTKIFTSVLLAFAIQVVAMGQNSMNFAFQHDPEYVLGYTGFTEEQRREFSLADHPSVLSLTADNLAARAGMLYKAANLKRDKSRERMFKEAAHFKQLSEIYYLAACEFVAYNNRMEFQLLKRSLRNMLGADGLSEVNAAEAKGCLLAAVRNYRLAVELREEAYAQQSRAAILANLRMAEEKEMIALAKLVEGIRILEQKTPVIIAKK